jgi:hypothetical protein
MNYSTATLGSGTVAKLRDRASAAVLQIGRDRYSRTILSAGECFNFIAAARLNDAIAKLNVKDTADLYRRIEPEALALPRIGAFAFAVLGTCFEAKGVGTLDQWVERSRVKGEPVVTFHTIKHQIAAQTSRETKQPRRSKSATAPREYATAADAPRLNKA